MENKQLAQAPWRDSKGNFLPTETIKAISKDWSPETWEQYLRSLEVPQREECHADIEAIAQSQPQEEPEETAPKQSLNPLLKQRLTAALDTLSPGQQEAIRGTYFDGESERQIARRLGVSRQTVRKNKVRGIKALRQIMPPTLPLYIGGENSEEAGDDN